MKKGEDFKMFIQSAMALGLVSRIIVLQPDDLTVSAIVMQIDEMTYQKIKQTFFVEETRNRDVEIIRYKKSGIIIS